MIKIWECLKIGLIGRGDICSAKISFIASSSNYRCYSNKLIKSILKTTISVTNTHEDYRTGAKKRRLMSDGNNGIGRNQFIFALKDNEPDIINRMIKALNDLGSYNCTKGLY